jgi:PAS domain S-box-containing protein
MLLIVVLAVILWSAQEYAAGDRVLPAPQPNESAGVAMPYKILEDPAGMLQLEDVLAPATAARFALPTSDPFPHPFERTTYWLRLELPVAETASTRLVELSMPTQASVFFYLVGGDDQVLKTIRTGAYSPFSTRDVLHPNFVFTVDLPPGTASTVFLRLAMELPASVSLRVWSPVDFAEADGMRQLLWGAAYGILFIMAIYLLNLFIRLRQRTYLYMALYVLASCMTYAVVDGRAHQFLWPHHGELVAYVFPLSIALVSIFLLLFSMSFLETLQRARKLHMVLIALTVMNIGVVLALVWADPLAILRIGFLLLIPTIVTVLVATIFVLRMGYTPARYFALAQAAPLLIGLVPIIAVLAGRAYEPFLSELSVPGNILLVIFASHALADRINFLQQENRRVLDAYHESERRLVQFLEAIPVGIAVYDANLELIYVNQTALDLADRPDGAQTGTFAEAFASYHFYRSGTDCAYPSDQLPLMQALHGRVSSVEDIEIATPARRYPAAMWATPVKNPQGDVDYAVCAFQDISAIRAVQRAASKAQALYRSIVDDQPAFICRFLADGRLSFANLAFASIVGDVVAAVGNTSVFDLMNEEDAVTFRRDVDALGVTQQVQASETRMRNSQGRIVWVQWTTRALFNDQGQLTEYQSVGLDVTKAKAAERELARYRRQLEELVAARTAALSQANEDLQRRAEELATLNAITQTLASTTELDVVLPEILVQLAIVMDFAGAQIYLRNGPWLTIAESDGVNASNVPTQLALANEQNALVQVFTEQRTSLGDGSIYAPGPPASGDRDAGSWVGAPLLVGAEPIGVLAVTADRSDAYGPDDVRNLRAFADQAAVAVLNARLHEQAQEAAVAHERARLARELHDAVTQTLFSASIMAEALPQQWQVDPAGAMITLDKLRQMTRGALAEMRALLWELRSGEIEATPLSALLRQLGDALTGNTLVPVLVKCTPPDLLLPGDIQLVFYRVAQEALNNVAKHATATSVEIVASADGGRHMLDITDDGCGFDPEVLGRGHLGLAIMQERVDAIDGELEIVSKPGHGTRIVVRWQSPEGTKA